MFGSLHHRGFRLLWTGSLCSYGGHWVQQSTLGWVVYELTGSGSLLGLILGIRALPILAFAPLAGALADRRGRRNLLAATQLLYVGTTLAVALLLAFGALHTWHLFALVLATGVAHVFDRTVRQAMISDLVPPELVVDAVSLGNIAFSITRVLAPAVAGYLLAWFGAAGSFFGQCLLYLLGLATLLALRGSGARARGHSAPRGGLFEGFRYAARDRTTRLALFYTALPFLLLSPTWSTLMPVFARDVFGAGPQALGWLLAAGGAGGLAGGLAAGMLARFDRVGRVQIVTLAAFALALAGIAAAPSASWALPCAFVAGAAELMNATAGQTLLQVSAPAPLRGRILSLYALSPAVISIGSLGAGLGADWLGARAITAWSALAALAIGLAVAFGSAHLRNLRLSDYTRGSPPSAPR